MSEHQSIPQQHCTTGQLLYLSEADFHECLVQFFRPFVSIRPIDWTCIQKSETYFAPFFKFKEFGYLYFDYIYCLFEDFRIMDKGVTDSFLKKYYRFGMKNIGFPPTNPDEFQYPVDGRKAARLCYCKHIGEPKALEELLTRPIVYIKPKVVAWILRFNAAGRIRHRDLPCYMKYVMSCIRKDPLLADNVDYFRWNQKDGAMGRKRLKLTLMFFEFVLKVRDRNYKGSLEALWVLFQAIPDPYITWQEISRFLTLRLTPSENQQSYIKSFEESCKKHFPACQRGLRPRSLKHLARCRVRRCLKMSLPHGVWGLRLPRELEDYVLLQERKSTFRPVTRPLSSERKFILGPMPAIQSSADPNVYLDLPREVYDC